MDNQIPNVTLNIKVQEVRSPYELNSQEVIKLEQQIVPGGNFQETTPQGTGSVDNLYPIYTYHQSGSPVIFETGDSQMIFKIG